MVWSIKSGAEQALPNLHILDIMPIAANTVLIVDDDPAFRSLIKKRLETAGFETNEARDGAQAIDILQVECPDVVLLDINMPVMNGYDVLEWLKHNQVVSANVIVLTGESVRDHVVSCLTLGAKDFLVKSAGKLELLSRVRRLCETRHLEESTHYQITDKDLHAAPILIVDDQELSVDLTARRLIKDGFTVYKAYSGREALQVLQDQEIRLVLLDIEMPDISGNELLKKIRQRFLAEELAVIMLTAIDDSDMVIECISQGADDYIMKPFHQAELMVRIHTTLHHKLIAYRDYQRRSHHEELARLGEEIRNTK